MRHNVAWFQPAIRAGPKHRNTERLASMLSLVTTEQAAQDITGPVSVQSLKYALWAASLSPQKKLSWNIAQARALLPYVNAPLPQDTEAVYQILRAAHPFVSHNNARYILKIEQAERDGRLAELAQEPTTYTGWLHWRLAVVGLHAGLSYKAASFVALLLWPLDCPLIPVDSHVCARLGAKELYKPACSSYKVYRWLEKQVLHEWYHSGHRHDVSPAVWHWYKWSQWRQATGDEPVQDRPETHKGLTLAA